jgi:hypothetical protein
MGSWCFALVSLPGGTWQITGVAGACAHFAGFAAACASVLTFVFSSKKITFVPIFISLFSSPLLNYMSC